MLQRFYNSRQTPGANTVRKRWFIDTRPSEFRRPAHAIIKALSCAFWISSSSALAGEAFPEFGGNLDVSLGYSDLLKRPATTGGPKLAITPWSSMADVEADQTRTLGLRRASLGISAKRPGSSILALTLRPEAASNRGEPIARDFDSRAGSTYRATPRIVLLDEYRLTFEQQSSYSLGIGVFNQIAPFRASYPQILAFGLEAKLPEKSLAIRLTWKSLGPHQSVPNDNAASGRSFDLYVMEGREDRGELLSRSTRSNDSAPSASDPDRGLALATNHQWSEALDYGGTFGYIDTRLSDSGHLNELFGALYGAFRFRLIGQYPSRMTWDSRVSREYWRGGGQRFHSLQQLSHALTLSHEVMPKAFLVWGLHYGMSQRHPQGESANLVVFEGIQGDLGLIRQYDDNLSFSLMTSSESREQVQDGTRSGGFDNEIARRGALKRFAFEIRYMVSKE